MVWLGHMVILFLVFLFFCKSLCTYFHRATEAAQIFIPTNSVSRFLSPHPLQHLLSFVFLMLAILTGVQWNFNVILIFFSLWLRMLNVYVFNSICTSFENSLLNSFVQLWIILFVLLVFNFWSPLYIMDVNPLYNE
jgi:hypothetical protein